MNIFGWLILAVVATGLFSLFLFLKKQMKKEIEGKFSEFSPEALKNSSEQFLLLAKQTLEGGQRQAQADLEMRQQTAAKNSDIVVALIDDEATIKEFHKAGETVILKPRSRNKEHKPIVLTKDFQIQGVVITSIPPI